MENTYYSEDASSTILSLQRILQQYDAHAMMKGNQCKVIAKGKVILTVELACDNLYHLSSHNIQENKVELLQYNTDINYWHQVLGHLNPRAIIEMSKRQNVKGLPNNLSITDFKPCPRCSQGKATKRKRKRNNPEKEVYKNNNIDIADAWHSDQKGPISPTSVHHNRYIILFIDEATGYVEPFFLKTLDESEEKYRILRKRLHTHLGKRPKFFICDGH